MRKLLIACAGSCRAKYWQNGTVSWEALCARLQATQRTPETVAEYHALPRARKEAAKDHGGFVGGRLQDGRRKIGAVLSRSLLTLDVDAAAPDFIARFVAECPYAALLYTTHGHTPAAPRVRILLPLAEDITAAEYAALARAFATAWGAAQFDECSCQPNQLMYWPSTPADGEYICRVLEGDWLDGRAYLAAHQPVKAETKPLARTRQADPLTKQGAVGAFCRAYSIDGAIAHYLTGIYMPAGVAGRYTYLPGEGEAGLVVYDGKFAYSHHATDPARGKLLNAFDLVRVHKFGKLDGKKSFEAMCGLALADAKVQARLREAGGIPPQAKQTGGIPAPAKQTGGKTTPAKQTGGETTPAKQTGGKTAPAKQTGGETAPAKEAAGEGTAAWQDALTRDRYGGVQNTLQNLTLILQRDERLQPIVFNRLADSIEIKGEVPWQHPSCYWREADEAQLICYVDRHYAGFALRHYDVAVTKVADDRSYHPIHDYLASLPAWDGVPRLETLLVDYLGAADTPYVRAVTRKVLCAAVLRVLHPGSKFDYMLVLSGPQGIGKSTLIARLGGAWYSDSLSLSDMNDKTAAEKLQGYWIMEIGELAGMKKADIDKVKAFISRQDDKYRPAFGHRVITHPRQCIFCGTTNSEAGFLRDITGNRRFWTVSVPGQAARQPWELTPAETGQLWAEALSYAEAGEKLYLPPELEASARRAQSAAMEQDDREGLVADYLDLLLPAAWDDMDIYHRRQYVQDPGNPMQPVGTRRRERVSNIEIWCECFGKEKADLRPSDSYAITSMMIRLPGWEKTGRVASLPAYGRQRIYERSE